VCRPHAALCVALRAQIVQAIPGGMDNGSFYGSLLSSSASAVEQQRANREGSESIRHRLRKFLGYDVPKKPHGPFYECAKAADEAGMTWVRGLALLECPDDSEGAWTTAYDIFSRSEYTGYELARAHDLFVKNSLKLPAKSWVIAMSAIKYAFEFISFTD